MERKIITEPQDEIKFTYIPKSNAFSNLCVINTSPEKFMIRVLNSFFIKNKIFILGKK